MKKNYLIPEINTFKYECEDIISTSNVDDLPLGGPDDVEAP